MAQSAGRHLPGVHSVGLPRLQPCLHRRRRLHRHAGADFPARHRARYGLAAGQDHPRKPVHALPDDLRHHHGGAGGGLGGGPHALLGVSAVLRLVAAAGLCADRALGLGRRLPRRLRHDRFRRRPGGASQCRHRRPGCGLRHRCAARLWQREPVAVQPGAGGDRHRPVVGRLARLQRRPVLWRQWAPGHGDRLHASRRQRRRFHMDGAGVVDAASRRCSA